MIDNGYSIQIERGHSALNDYIIYFLKWKILNGSFWTKFIDIGSNCGYLLSEIYSQTGNIKTYVGIDASPKMIDIAKSKELDVYLAEAEHIPFPDKFFDISVLSCILQQCSDPHIVLAEAIRVTKNRIIGICPFPGKTWGVLGPNVKSILSPEIMKEVYNAKIEHFDQTGEVYYFEINL